MTSCSCVPNNPSLAHTRTVALHANIGVALINLPRTSGDRHSHAAIVQLDVAIAMRRLPSPCACCDRFVYVAIGMSGVLSALSDLLGGPISAAGARPRLV